MKKKRILALALAGAVCLSLAACGSSKTNDPEKSAKEPAVSQSQNDHYPVTVNSFNYAGRGYSDYIR